MYNFIYNSCISPSFKNGIIRLEAGAFKFLRNRLFMTSMQLPLKRNVPPSAISKMSRAVPRCRKNNMRYSAKELSALATVSYSLNRYKYKIHTIYISIVYTYWLGMRVITLLLSTRYQLYSEATSRKIVGTEGTIKVLLPEYQVYKCFIILNNCAIQNSKLGPFLMDF